MRPPSVRTPNERHVVRTCQSTPRGCKALLTRVFGGLNPKTLPRRILRRFAAVALFLRVLLSAGRQSPYQLVHFDSSGTRSDAPANIMAEVETEFPSELQGMDLRFQRRDVCFPDILEKRDFVGLIQRGSIDGLGCDAYSGC